MAGVPRLHRRADESNAILRYLAGREGRVGAHGHVLGGGFSLADCAVAPALWRSGRLPLGFGAWPKVRRLRDSLVSRPAFVAAGPVA